MLGFLHAGPLHLGLITTHMPSAAWLRIVQVTRLR